MSFPTISAADARRFLTALANGEEPLDPSVRTQTLGPERDWDEIAESIKEALTPLRDSAGDGISRQTRVAARFEAMATVEVYKLIPQQHPAVGDPTFWIWLAITHFRDLIGWRYGTGPNEAHPENYGIGKGGKENLLYRLWMRAEIAYDRGAADPYHIARLGNIDFWRSHVLRQGYSNGRQFARALARFQFPGGPQDKSRLGTDDIRELAKRLRAARSNLIVEIMDRDRATEFIRGEWSKLTLPSEGAEATA
jgi:hypothetical protein